MLHTFCLQKSGKALVKACKNGKRREVRDLLRRKDVKPNVTHVGIHIIHSLIKCVVVLIGALDTTASG